MPSNSLLLLFRDLAVELVVGSLGLDRLPIQLLCLLPLRNPLRGPPGELALPHSELAAIKDVLDSIQLLIAVGARAGQWLYSHRLLSWWISLHFEALWLSQKALWLPPKALWLFRSSRILATRFTEWLPSHSMIVKKDSICWKEKYLSGISELRAISHCRYQEVSDTLLKWWKRVVGHFPAYYFL